MPDASDATDSQKSPQPRPVGSFTAAPPKPGPTTTAPPSATQPTPLPTAPRPVETPARRPGEGLVPPMMPTPKARETETRRLIVGREISLTGEITACERLIVEGSVEANLNNCREVEIADVGLLKGTASIEEAEIRGRFEGTLTVRKRLLIKSTGKVSGVIRYGQLEVECGGQLSGDVQAQPSVEDEARPPRPMAAAVGDMKL